MKFKKSFCTAVGCATLLLTLNISTTFGQTPQWAWTDATGESGDDYGQSVTTDQNGNIYIAGSFGSATITFGSYTLTNEGSLSAFLVKYDASGSVLWAIDPQICSFNKGYGVATDAFGNVYMVGGFLSDTIMFGSTMLFNLGTFASYVVKYDSNGNFIWAKTATGMVGGDDNAYAIAIDNDGYLYVTGEFKSDTIMFDNYTLINAGSYDAYVAKYDSDGNVIWATNSVGASGDFGRGIVVDNAGNLYVTGHYGSSTLSFDAFTILNNGGYDAYIAKYDTSGNALWVRNVYGSGTENSKGIAIDNSGNPIFTGHSLSPTLTCGSTVLTNTSLSDMYLVKYDGTGNVLWAKNSSGTSYDYGWGIATDSQDAIYIVGHSKSPTLNFGTNSVTNNGGHDVYVVKYSSAGSDLWAVNAGGTLDDRAYSIALDNQDKLIISGMFESSAVNFGSDILSSSGGYDFFIASMGTSTAIESDLDLLNQSFIYPNPAESIIKIEYEGDDYHSIEITNMNGRVVYENTLNNEQTVRVSNYPSGIYFIKLTGDEIMKIERLVKL